jgi:hypothetical protein
MSRSLRSGDEVGGGLNVLMRVAPHAQQVLPVLVSPSAGVMSISGQS